MSISYWLIVSVFNYRCSVGWLPVFIGISIVLFNNNNMSVCQSDGFNRWPPISREVKQTSGVSCKHSRFNGLVSRTGKYNWCRLTQQAREQLSNWVQMGKQDVKWT